MTLPPIWLCAPPAGGGAPGDAAKKMTSIESAINDPNIVGVLANAPWNDASYDEFTQVVGMSTKPWSVRPFLMPLPDGVPSFQMNGASCGKVWDPEYAPLLQDHIQELLTLSDDEDLSASCDGMAYVFVSPYDYDPDECGYKGEDNGVRNDSTLAAAGYTPSGYIAAATTHATFLNNLPDMAGKTIRLAFFTPGDEPRVNDAGQVVPAAGDEVVARTIAQMIRTTMTNCTVLPVYGVFAAGVTIPQFWLDMRDLFGGLILQLKTGLDLAGVIAALKAIMALDWVPARIEVHVDQVPMLQAAIAAIASETN